MADPADPANVADAIRANAANRLRELGLKQQRIAATWLASVGTANQFISTSSSLMADALAKGKLEPGVWLSNAVAVSIELLGSAVDACLGSASAKPGGVQSIMFEADAAAQLVGPIALAGATANQEADVQCTVLTPLAPVGFGGALAPKKTKHNTDLLVEVALPPNVPAGVYSGAVTLNEAGKAKVIATITLVRI